MKASYGMLLGGVALGLLVSEAWEIRSRAGAQTSFASEDAADTPRNDHRYSMTTGRIGAWPDTDALFILDGDTQRLAVYAITKSNLGLRHVRNVTYDFLPDEYNYRESGQDPSVTEMKAAATKKP